MAYEWGPSAAGHAKWIGKMCNKMQKAGGTCWSLGEKRRAAAASKDTRLSQSEIQNNCLCRFNNLPKKGRKRERGEGEKESWLWNAKHITIIKQTKLKGKSKMHRIVLSRLHIMQSSQGCRDASHYRATRVICSLPAPSPQLFPSFNAHTHRRRYP